MLLILLAIEGRDAPRYADNWLGSCAAWRKKCTASDERCKTALDLCMLLSFCAFFDGSFPISFELSKDQIKIDCMSTFSISGLILYNTNTYEFLTLDEGRSSGGGRSKGRQVQCYTALAYRRRCSAAKCSGRSVSLWNNGAGSRGRGRNSIF